ncbi:MAG: hypothetical protein AABX40_07195 [Candidatus Hydrothermarchaeota archaeon]
MAKDWPVEKGRYLLGDPKSPIAVAVILNTPYNEISREEQALLQRAVGRGAAIAGFLQTANIGIAKLLLNLAANGSIKYLILAGRESGHGTGEAVRALFARGVDEGMTIVGAKALDAVVRGVPREAVEEVRRRVRLVDIAGTVDAKRLEEAIDRHLKGVV